MEELLKPYGLAIFLSLNMKDVSASFLHKYFASC
jgi:hypothetical protein